MSSKCIIIVPRMQLSHLLSACCSISCAALPSSSHQHSQTIKASVASEKSGIPYSGLFSWVKIFREKLEEAPRIKFRGFNFRGAISIRLPCTRNVNFELGTRGESFAVDERKMERFSVESWVRG